LQEGQHAVCDDLDRNALIRIKRRRGFDVGERALPAAKSRL
jgi:hypothetical protein